MKSRVLITGLIMLLACVNTTFAAHHQGNSGTDACSMEQITDHMTEMMTAELDLNKDQVQLLNNLNSQIAELHRSKSEDKTDTRESMRTLLSEPTLDQKKMLKTVKNNSGELVDMAKDYIPVLAAFTDSLTKEQRVKFVDMSDMYLPGMHGKMGGFHGKDFHGKSHGKKCCADTEYKKCCPKGDKATCDKTKCSKGDKAQCKSKCDKSKCDKTKCSKGDRAQCKSTCDKTKCSKSCKPAPDKATE